MVREHTPQCHQSEINVKWAKGQGCITEINMFPQTFPRGWIMKDLETHTQAIWFKRRIDHPDNVRLAPKRAEW